MDFVIKKLNSYIEMSDEKSVDRQTFLRERVEYLFFVVLGCLWNCSLQDVSVSERKRIVENRSGAGRDSRNFCRGPESTGHIEAKQDMVTIKSKTEIEYMNSACVKTSIFKNTNNN